MAIRENGALPAAALQFFERCYKFVNLEWQHENRDSFLNDQGYEKRFRERCIHHLGDWTISQERELALGQGLDSASGVAHEVDIVATHVDLLAILEIKNRQSSPPDKNDIIVFFAKILDYLALHPRLLLGEVCPVFLSQYAFEESGLAACLGLGVHPVGPGLRPLPMLFKNARMMVKHATQDEVILSSNLRDDINDFCARLNALSVALQNTWKPARCGYGSDDTLILKAVGSLPVHALSHDFRTVNSDCTRILDEIRR